MQVISGDLFKNLGSSGVDRNAFRYESRHWLLPFAIDQDRDQLIASIERSLHHTVAFTDKDALHIAPAFATHSQRMVSQTLEHLDPRIKRVDDRNRVF